MTEKKRKRGQNFTTEEKHKLIKLVKLHKDAILNHRTDAVSNEAKGEAWISIADSFNSSSNTDRDKESLLNLWDKLKRDSKVYYAKMRTNMTQADDGGPSMINTDPVLEKVCCLLGRGCTDILDMSDCDAESEPKEKTALCEVYLVQDGQLRPKAERTIVEENDTDDEEFQFDKSQKLQDNKKTPRRSEISSHNERSEATSIFFPSMSNVYKRNESVKDLRKNILWNELEFKTKLYNLQLQAAAKDLEIKNAILEQIKSGCKCRTADNINGY